MSIQEIESLTTKTEECSFLKDIENNEECLDNDCPTLTDLPNEIFFKICSFLDLEFVSSVLTKVCEKFYNILEDTNLWRYWFSKRINARKFPIFEEYVENFDWRNECIAIDKINRIWKDIETKTYHYVSKPVHCASVDSLIVKNNGIICMSGSRDRSMTLWNFATSLREKKEDPDITDLHPSFHNLNAHGGWVWDLATPSTSSNLVYSASWDSTVKVWDAPILFKNIQTIKCPISVLSVTCVDENVAVAGLFSPNIAILDIRTGNKPVSVHQIHKRAVLDVTVKAPESNIVYTGSEDGTISAFDLRKSEVFQKKKLDCSQEQVFPLKLAANDKIFPRILFAGDTHGNVHMMDMNDLNIIFSYPICGTSAKTNKITGLSIGAGAVFSCSNNGSVDIMSPSNPPNKIGNVSCISKELTALSFDNNTLAVSGGTSAVEFWIPRID